MTTFQIATLGFYAVQSLIGLAQCALIFAGLLMMNRASRNRARAMDTQLRAMDAAEKEAERRHAQAMATHAENMAAHAESLEPLKALIRNNRGAGQAGD